MFRVPAFVAALLALSVAATAPAQFCLTTTFNNNNGQNGNMFDVVATNPVLINDFDLNLDSGSWTVEVHVVTGGGSHAPYATDPANWTLIGTASVTSAGTGNPTNLGLSLGYLIPAGATQGFYLHATSGSPFNYTNGTSVGTVAASDSNIQILEGLGKGSNWGTSFMPRIWNGTICYTPGSGIFAGFDASVTAGPAPLTVNFTDQSFSSASGGVSTWLWSFGDGSFSTSQNPTHTYTTAGVYDVSLTVSDPVNGSDTETKTGLIVVDVPLLIATSSGGGVGDLVLTGPPDPVGTTEGYLLTSMNTSNPVGSGGFFGLWPDAMTFQIIGYPALVGGLFHYLPHPATFPNVPFVVPAGIVPFPAGTTLDAVLLQIVNGGIVTSNITRVTF